MSDFKDKLRRLRSERNLTQKQLAVDLGITERNYQHYEAGTKKPSFDGLIKLADLFNVPADYLLGRDNYWQDSDGYIRAKVPVDVFNLDTDVLKKERTESSINRFQPF